MKSDNKSKKLNELAQQKKDQLQAESTYQRILSPDPAPQKFKTESEKLTKPGLDAASESGEEAFTGDTAALSSDDNIDKLGARYGVSYKSSEKLNMASKVKISTEPKPPEKHKPSLDVSFLNN